MKNYIFDKERDDFMRNDDGEKIFFQTQDEVYRFLKAQEFTDEWIKENFFIMKGCKILIPEEIETSAPPQPIEQQLKNHAIDFSDFLVRENYVNRSLPHEKSQFYEKMELGKSYPVLHIGRIYDEWLSKSNPDESPKKEDEEQYSLHPSEIMRAGDIGLSKSSNQKSSPLSKKEDEGYWRKRCEAAEEVIDKFAALPPNRNDLQEEVKIVNYWQSLKQSPLDEKKEDESQDELWEKLRDCLDEMRENPISDNGIVELKSKFKIWSIVPDFDGQE